MTTTQRTSYGFGLMLKLRYDDAVERIKAALKEQGFGVLAEIDVKQTMKQKLGVDFRPYVILGVCNPPLAHRALLAELDLGLLLPCNVVVYDADGGSVIRIMDPEAALGIVGNPALEPIAREAKARLERALDSVKESTRLDIQC